MSGRIVDLRFSLDEGPIKHTDWLVGLSWLVWDLCWLLAVIDRERSLLKCQKMGDRLVRGA